MKKLVLILVIFLLGCKDGNMEKAPVVEGMEEVKGIEVDPKLKYWVNDFFIEAEKRKLELDSSILRGVYLHRPPRGAYGVTFLDNTDSTFFIIIDPQLKNSPHMLRTVVYHELGHVYLYGRLHPCYDCDHIMAETLSNRHWFKPWEVQKEQFFRQSL